MKTLNIYQITSYTLASDSNMATLPLGEEISE
jgi:hypothetical protein